MRIKFIQFFMIILLIPFSAYSSDESCLKAGDYISEAFIKKLIQNHSIEKASYGLNFISASVSQKEKILQIGLSNLHDSIFLNILPDCHTIKDVKKYKENYVFERINENSFKINNEKEKIIFKYVGNKSEDWIAIQILSGEWSDKNGNDFSFQKDGNVKINGSLFPYTIGEQVHGDMVGIVYDIVVIGDSNYFFDFKNNKLFLYESTWSDISKEPKYILNSKNH